MSEKQQTIELPHEWEPRDYQIPAWEYHEGPGEGKRSVHVWHRRSGKDLFAINVIAPKLFERVGTYWHVLPTYKQGRKIVWNGMTRDGRRFLDHFPKQIIKSKNQTEMRLTFINGSVYEVQGTDNIDSLVGTNPIGVVFSEYSLQDPAVWDYVRPILAENGGWAMFIYTARGKNHGYKLLEMARHNKKWFCDVLVAGDKGTKRPDGTPVISDALINEERLSGMPEEMIQQEFYCSFEAPMVGAYYGKQMIQAAKDSRIGSVPWEEKLPVNTWWDIGVADSTSIVFTQDYGLECRVIDYYENSGEGLAHYAKVLTERGYMYGTHTGPWDIQVRELGTGKSRLETAKDMGIKFRVVPQAPIEDGIEVVRQLLGSCWFDETKCDRLIEALRQYRKEWDESKKVFAGKPLHDWTSHPCDAFRTLAMGKKNRPKTGNRAPQKTAQDNFNYL